MSESFNCHEICEAKSSATLSSFTFRFNDGQIEYKFLYIYLSMYEVEQYFIPLKTWDKEYDMRWIRTRLLVSCIIRLPSRCCCANKDCVSFAWEKYK